MSDTNARILAEFDAFNAKCEEAEYTDTGDAWFHLNRLADALRSQSAAEQRGWDLVKVRTGRLRSALVALVAENVGELDEWEQEVVDAFNVLPGVEPIVTADEDGADTYQWETTTPPEVYRTDDDD